MFVLILLAFSCELLQPPGGRTVAQGRQLPRTLAAKQTPTDVASNRNKLAVIVLMTDLQFKGADRVNMLRGNIRLCEAHLFPNTPSIMYIFSLEENLPRIKEGLDDLLQPHIRLMALNMTTWQLPHSAQNRSQWHGHWNTGYRLMGDWRLSFQQEFARQQGHRYVLQFDDNSYITEGPAEDLVALFKRKQYVLGAQRECPDAPLVTWGLPELAKYFLVTNQVEPTILFEHCKPPNISGLYSAMSSPHGEAKELEKAGKLFGLVTEGGWDRTVYGGNCILMDLDWWFQPMVQEFVQLCRDSGGSIRFRWNEQGVISMAVQMFVPKQQYLNLSTFINFVHRVRTTEALVQGGLQP